MVDHGQDVRISRGLSRRDMIKGAAAAGAAAWTAPMIIDSLTSPAAAFSGCNKKYLKLQTGSNFNTCCTFNPGCGLSRDGGTTNLCTGGPCPGTKSALAGSVASYDSTYYKITIPATCGFDATKFSPSWAVQGNNGSCTNLSGQATDTGPSGNGYFVIDGQVAYIKKSKASQYIYLQYCCTS